MSDPIDRLLDAAESGKTIIKNREILQTTYIPNTIQHRNSESIEENSYSSLVCN